MALYDSSWKDFTDTGIITGEYIIFYQGGPIEHCKHVPGPVSQSRAKSEYNAACTTWMALAHLRMLIHELLNKYPYIVPDVVPLIILDRKSAVCMAKNGKDTKYTKHIDRRLHLMINGEK